MEAVDANHVIFSLMLMPWFLDSKDMQFRDFRKQGEDSHERNVRGVSEIITVSAAILHTLEFCLNTRVFKQQKVK